MIPNDAYHVFDSLTDKQHETLMLAAAHLTSKQIALELSVSPVTIDKRIEALRARLGFLARTELLRLYRQWCQIHDRTIDDPIILGVGASDAADLGPQPADHALLFEDSILFDARSSWDQQRGNVWLHPGLNPSDLGVTGKLLVMLGGAVAIMMVAVLCMAFVDALMSIIAR